DVQNRYPPDRQTQRSTVDRQTDYSLRHPLARQRGVRQSGQGIHSARGERDLMIHKKVLGRGLGALIPQRQEALVESHATQGLAEIPLTQIRSEERRVGKECRAWWWAQH